MARAQADSRRRLHGTLRQRVVASFVILVGMSLLGVGTYVYFQTENRLAGEVDSSLRAAASQALLSLEEDEGRLVLRGEGSTFSRADVEAGFALRVLSVDGVQSDAAGQAIAGLPTPPAPGYLDVNASGEDWRVLTEAVPDVDGQTRGWVQVARPLAPTESLLQTLRTQLYLVLPIALVLAAIAAYLLTARTLRPLITISYVADSIRSGDLGQRIRYRGPGDEVGKLAAAFDRMLDRVENAFVRERRFTSDASHELRTPLTAIKGGIGVTLSRQRTPAEYKAALRDLEGQVDRLIRLSTSLLVVARAGRTRNEEPEIVDLSDLLGVTVQQMEPLAQEKGVELEIEVPSGLCVSGFAEDLVRVLSNLLANAIRFTPPSGRIRVLARGYSRGQTDPVCIDVVDTGAGIAAEDLPYIFEPFYRGRDSLSGEEESSGLGLAIARDIVVAHGGSLDVVSRRGKGSTFTVRLPVFANGDSAGAAVRRPRSSMRPPKPGGRTHPGR